MDKFAVVMCAAKAQVGEKRGMDGGDKSGCAD
jgi:hypothetical protein